MRSYADVVTVLLHAVAKRRDNNTKAVEKGTLTPQQRQGTRGQIEASEAILGDLTDLYTAITEGKGDPDQLVLGTLMKWRREAQQWLSNTFSAHAKSEETFANRYFGNKALIYAYVADELAYAVETRAQYEPVGDYYALVDGQK